MVSVRYCLLCEGNHLSSNTGVNLSDPHCWEAIHQEKVQTFLIFNSLLLLFDLVRGMILWDVCRFASEAFAISPTQVFNWFNFPTDMGMTMVSAILSKLHFSCHGSFTWGDLWSYSYKGSKPDICHAPEAAMPSHLMFFRAAQCSALLITLVKAAVCERSWVLNKPLDYWAPLVSCHLFCRNFT